MNQLMEIRSLNLKSGYPEEFHRLYFEKVHLLLKRWDLDAIAQFSGEEAIFFQTKQVYLLTYHGGKAG